MRADHRRVLTEEARKYSVACILALLLGRSENSTEVQVPAGWTRRSLASVGHIPSSRSVIAVMNETLPM